MATQNFNMENIEKVAQIREELEETFGKIVPACESSVDLAKDSGSAKFIGECEASVDGAQAFKKQFDQLNETIIELLNYYKKLDAALN